jgi:N-acetylmuramoyl-L-alanine amidase
MKADASDHSRSIGSAIQVALAITAAVVLLAAPTLAQRRASSKTAAPKLTAKEQFEQAVAMRTALENEPQQDRTIDEYKACVTAYRKVYLISASAAEATPSLIASAELYQAMGKQFDPQYYDNAIVTYDLLLKEYPKSRYNPDALFTIGQIQQQSLNRLDDAESTFRRFLKEYPDSERTAAARAALQQIAQVRDSPQGTASALAASAGNPADANLPPSGAPQVTSIRSWNAENYTRIVVDLQGAIKYESARITNPDRIYFDLYSAKLSPSLMGKTLSVDNGFLKAIRVAQNKAGVVRIVLDVDSVKEYSAFLLPNPYRLVIDVHGKPENLTTARNTSKTSTATAAEATDATGAPKSEPDEGANELADKPPNGTGETAAPASAQPLAKPAARLPVRHAPEETASVEHPTTRDGEHSLTRELGLKINRIVIDPGHGGHDTGTIGRHGLAEKDLCLDVALRLGNLILQKLPNAQVVYTRKDDTFVPLEERTAIANQAKADLFISIHANSSRDSTARGVETYYLNFTTSNEAMEVATRENALSGASIHDLQDMISKIATNDKVEESRELAGDIQDALSHRLQQMSTAERSRGVKKAPFVVLIGADMPSVLAEISFLSNPYDEKMLRRADQRQRIADGLFRGVSAYLVSLNSLNYNKQKLVSTTQPGSLVSDSNPK